MQPRNLSNLLLVLLLPAIILAQPKNKILKDSLPLGNVNVVMTNSKLAPSKGEQIIFVGTHKKSFAGKTDAQGKFSIQLPAGDDYTIKVKGVSDSIQYGILNIPSLGPGESFTGASTVTIKYDAPVNFTLRGVQYDVGKATLRPSSLGVLNELYDYMKWKDGQQIEIAGHTDNAGKPDENIKLSQQRAESVKAFLVKKGIAATRIIAKGYGDTQPVADNATADGKQQNRRTEVKVLNPE